MCMVKLIHDDLDIKKIAESGQTFRWVRADADRELFLGEKSASVVCKHAEVHDDRMELSKLTYRVLSSDKCLYITDLGDDNYELDCTEEEFENYWKNYLDLDENYSAIRGRIDRESDPYLYEAAESGRGIRILRQDPWEMLISFIISQNKNIPAIMSSIEKLCMLCGEEMTDSHGEMYHVFPTPDALATVPEEALRSCSLGYRCPYIHETAVRVSSGEFDIEVLLDADEDTTIQNLTSLLGVGPKVANCVSLFGLHHIDAFPKDVWIKRVLAEHYPDGYPFEKYSPYNGIYQQYMFYGARVGDLDE